MAQAGFERRLHTRDGGAAACRWDRACILSGSPSPSCPAGRARQVERSVYRSTMRYPSDSLPPARAGDRHGAGLPFFYLLGGHELARGAVDVSDDHSGDVFHLHDHVSVRPDSDEAVAAVFPFERKLSRSRVKLNLLVLLGQFAIVPRLIDVDPADGCRRRERYIVLFHIVQYRDTGESIEHDTRQQKRRKHRIVEINLELV